MNDVLDFLYMFSVTIIPYNEAPFWTYIYGLVIGFGLGYFYRRK